MADFSNCISFILALPSALYSVVVLGFSLSDVPYEKLLCFPLFKLKDRYGVVFPSDSFQ